MIQSMKWNKCTVLIDIIRGRDWAIGLSVRPSSYHHIMIVLENIEMDVDYDQHLVVL